MAAESAVARIERSTADALGTPVMQPGEHIALRDLADIDLLTSLVGKLLPRADPRVSATLWWYSSTSALMSTVASQLLVTGSAIDPRSATVALDGGVVSAMTGTEVLHGSHAVRGALELVCSQLITILASIADGHEASMWAIASDSLANRALDAGVELGRIGEATSLAAALAPRAMPTPRYVDVEAGGVGRRFVRRNSCCLVLEMGQAKCISCPRQRPEVRARRLATLLG